MHASTNCANYTAGLAGRRTTTDQLAQWQANYPSSARAQPPTGLHCIAFSDWSSQPKAELANGMRLDTNYYYWPGSWIQNRPGFMTGSGMPMRFADTDGTMIDVYQATDPDDRRVRPGVPVHAQHAARQRPRPAGLLRRVQRQHAHRRGDHSRRTTR